MPSIKQKKAFDKTVENRGNVSKSMREVGYSEATAKNPKVLTESKGWKELMEQYLPDDLLGQKHLELLNKKEKVTKNNMTTGEIDVIDTGEIDAQAVKAGLDMAYKLKGKYAPEKAINVNIEIEQDPAIKELTNKLNEIYGRTSVSGDGGKPSSLGDKAPDKE